MKRAVGTLVGLLLLFSDRVSHAQGADDKAAAESLFKQGHALLTQNKLEEACAKLAESLRLDVGLGTMLYLAECYERSGRTASAWAQFREAQATAAKDKDPREKVARARADRLEPKLCKLSIVVPPESERADLVVTRDRTAVGRAAWGIPTPVDPGEHVVRVSAPGRNAWEKAVAVGASGVVVVVPALTAQAVVEAPVSPPVPAEPADPGRAPVAGGMHPQRIVALGVGGLGVAALGVGTFFGVRAISTLDEANRQCDGTRCEQAGADLAARVHREANASTILFALGGLAVAGGIVLWVTTPARARVTRSPIGGLQVGGGPVPGGGSAFLRGSLD